VYTQCPQCLTYFQVTPEHLKVAQGNVRCGQCRNVFSALGNLTELPPEAINQSAAKPKPQSFANNMSDTISDFERDLADEQDAVANPPKSTSGLSAAIEKINQLNKRSTNLNRNAPPPAKPPAAKPAARPAAAAAKEMPKPAASSAPYAKPAAPQPTPRAPARPAVAAKPVVTAAPRTAPMPAAASASAATNVNANANAALAKKRAPNPNPPAAPKPRPRTSSLSVDVDAALSAIDNLDITSDRQPRRIMEEITISSPPDAAAVSQERRVKSLERPQPSSPNLPAVTRPSSAIPKALLEDFQRAKAAAILAKHAAKGNIWVIGSVFMMIVFLSQTIYFKYDDLARISSLRPWMMRFCNVAHCELSLPFEIKKLELLGQDIRSHPKIRKALLVTVTLMNRAKYPQAYPGLEIKFMDMNSQMVAMRRFMPHDYLATDVNVDAGIPANTPIEVELQLIDPGSKAINFEFDMFRAS